jgi:integrase/recombinase XerD
MRLFQRNGWFHYEIRRGKSRSLKTKDPVKAKRLYGAIKKKFLAGKLHEIEHGARITLNQFGQRFFVEHNDLADDTTRAYDLAWRLFMDVVGKSTLLTHVDKAKINKFKSVCLSRGIKKVSVNTYLRHLRGILNKAFEWGHIKKKVKVELYKLPKRHPRILTSDEIDLLLMHSQHCHPEMHRIIKFGLWTGCRREEIHTLKWQNIHDGFCTVIGKGDKERTIPLLPGALEALGDVKDIGYVFLRSHKDYYSKAFKKLARDCGIEDISLHKLRHTSATKMLESGVGLTEVKEMLGHADIATTQIYAQVLQEHLRKEMMKFKL